MNSDFNSNPQNPSDEPNSSKNPPIPPQEPQDFWTNPPAAPINPEPVEPTVSSHSAPDAPIDSEPQPIQAEMLSEAQTPYQTPVRSSIDQPIYHDEAHQEEAQPFAPGTQSYETYQQWQNHHTKAQIKKKVRKPHSKKTFYMIGGVAAAAALFFGGMWLGGANSHMDSPAAPAANKNLPTLAIANTPSAKPDSSESSGKILSGDTIYQKLNPSIVAIQSVSNGQPVSSGSGVVMSSDGYIVTNAHVITNENSGAPFNASVLFSDGTQLEATIIGADIQSDLAVIKVNPKDPLTPAEFGNSDELLVGETAYAIGSPGGIELANSMTSGIISAINRDITVNDRVMSLIQTDVTINPGNSGGALINKYGQVVGITSAKLGISYYEGLGFAIPINSAKEIVDELIQHGYISGRPSIGITGHNIDAQMSQYRNLPEGVEIISIDSRANAASQGLQPGDVITAVNGKSITTMDEINAIKEDMKAGDKLTLAIYRPSAKKAMDVTITLTDAHDLEGSDPAQQQQQQQMPRRDPYGNGNFNPFQYFFNY